MARTRAETTRTTCDSVHIRMNPCHGKRNRYVIGTYYVRSSTIGLRLTKGSVERFQKEGKDVETLMAKTLLHEVTHWAEYLFMTREDWIRIAYSWSGIQHDDRLVEKIANEIMETWEW